MTGSSPGRAAVLAGIGAAVPARILTNDMLASRMDTSDSWIVSRTGIRQRRIVDPGTATSDLAIDAGSRALTCAGLSEVDAVVLATTTPDHPLPATAPLVATRLGLGNVPAYDIGAACSGFLYALASGAGMIAAGTAGRVLVIAAEAITTLVDRDDRNTAPIFGDGAGAAVLVAGEATRPGALRGFDLGSDGDLLELAIVPGGGSRERSTGGPMSRFLLMQGNAVFTQAVLRMAASSRTTLARAGWTTGDVDQLIGHQANVRILRAVAEQLGVAVDRAYTNLSRFGNTASASIPLALADAAASGVLTPGQRVLLTAFGAGATWGSVALEWPDLHPEPVLEHLDHR